MSNTTKKLTAGLLMAATTFTAVSSTCFANQVGFFNDGTGCETAWCYGALRDEMNHASDVLKIRIYRDKLPYEDDLMKKYYPEVFEKVDSAQKSIMECTDDNCIRENLEKIIDAEKQFSKENRVYIDSLNDGTRSELAERGLADAAFWYKNLYSTLDVLETFDENRRQVFWEDFYNNFCKITRPNFSFIEPEKAVYDYYKNTAAELGFDTSVSHKELIAQLKECDGNVNCKNSKWKIKLPTNNVLKTQNFYCAEPPTKFAQIKNKIASKVNSFVRSTIKPLITITTILTGLVLVEIITSIIIILALNKVAPAQPTNVIHRRARGLFGRIPPQAIGA